MPTRAEGLWRDICEWKPKFQRHHGRRAAIEGRSERRSSLKRMARGRAGGRAWSEIVRCVRGGAGMKVVCLGGGPAGLYFSILAKKANPSWDITVVERNAHDSTFGWGVVFSDKTMDGFKDVDPETHSEITRAFRHWDDIDVFFKGQKLTSGGHGFCGIGRIKL